MGSHYYTGRNYKCINMGHHGEQSSKMPTSEPSPNLWLLVSWLVRVESRTDHALNGIAEDRSTIPLKLFRMKYGISFLHRPSGRAIVKDADIWAVPESMALSSWLIRVESRTDHELNAESSWYGNAQSFVALHPYSDFASELNERRPPRRAIVRDASKHNHALRCSDGIKYRN